MFSLKKTQESAGVKLQIPWKKKLLYYFVMLFFAIFIPLLVGEMLLRAFYPQQEAMKWFSTDQRYGYFHKKNFDQKYHYIGTDFTMEVKTNSLGFRDKEYDLTRTDVKRVILLGDSFVFGYGINVQEHFDTRLEFLLNRGGEKFFVINAGVGGWGTCQELAFAKDHFDLLKPDVIVLTFCGNDPYDDLTFIHGMADNDRGLFFFQGKRFIKEHSHLYRFLYYKYHRLIHRVILNRELAKNQDAQLDLQSASVITETQWNATKSAIVSFFNEFLAFNPRGVLIIQATNPLNQNIRKNLQSLSNGQNLIFLDLYDEVNQLQPEELKLPFDGHWSPLMHSISADNLFSAILNLEEAQ